MPVNDFESLPFDQYQRYRVIRRTVERLREGRPDPQRVLDLGGHAYSTDGSRSVLPIRLCLPQDDTFVLDLQSCDSMGFVRGSGTAIPFAGDSFDVVVTCDTLEHVPSQERRCFLNELLRVTRDFVVLVAPLYQPVTRLAEEILELFITKTLGVVHTALQEHLLLGLPKPVEVEGFLKEAKVEYVQFPSGYVDNWLIMMMLKHLLFSVPGSLEMHQMIDAFYNTHFSGGDERPPGYRQVFVISKRGSRQLLDAVKKDHEALAEDSVRNETAQGYRLFQLLLSFLRFQREGGADADLRQQVINRELEIGRLEKSLVERDGQISELRRLLNEYHEHLTASQAKVGQAEVRLAEYGRALEEAKGRLETYHENLTASQAKLAYMEAKLEEYRPALEEARERLQVYHENLSASLAKLQQTEEVLERFKSGLVMRTMLKTQELFRRIRGSTG